MKKPTDDQAFGLLVLMFIVGVLVGLLKLGETRGDFWIALQYGASAPLLMLFFAFLFLLFG